VLGHDNVHVSLAPDDFSVPPGQTWTVSQVVIFAYQTGFAGGTSPITAGTLRIMERSAG
jgi:subtilase family serine protease